MKICRFCGKELADNTLFCVRCGKPCEDTGAQAPEEVQRQGAESAGRQAPENAAEQASENADGQGAEEMQTAQWQEEQAEPSKTKKKFLLPVVLGGIFVAAAVAGGAFWGLTHSREDKPASSSEQSLAEEDAIFDLSGAELLENYQPPEKTGTVDLGARNHQPASRDTSALWDKGLFYYLEDVGDGDDNHIAECLLTRMELVREDNGVPVEYEVYRDAGSGQVQKIVSIEPKEDGTLELSDYYYQDGTPNFVFRRSDSVYTPSYATIDKVGERYYFSGEQMVKWRWIYEPSVVKQWILEPEDTWYTQWGYMEISDDERAQYDDKEVQILNEAYNTYEAVLANEAVPVIQGRVTDGEGRPLEDVEVGIGKVIDGEIENPGVKVKTDEEGRYAWAPGQEEQGQEAQGQEYFLVFRKEGWLPSLMRITDGGTGNGALQLQIAQEDMVLVEEPEEGDGTVPVTFQVYQVNAQDGQESEETEGEEALSALSDAAVSVYRGVNWFFDEPVEEEVSASDGTASLELPAGIYTAVIEKEGFLPSRKVVLARGGEAEYAIYSLALEDGQAEDAKDADEWRILLSWDGSGEEMLDLDSSLFTPDKAAKGDRNCIYTLNRDDHAGARFLYDGKGKNACEMITLSAPKRGSYKYYVSNYTDIQGGNASSKNLAKSGANVTVFHNGMPVKTFPVPDEAGTVWEVFELREQGIVPIQEVYGNTAGKAWWTEDKQLARLSERSITADWIQSDGEWLYFFNPADQWKLYYCRKDGSDLTKLSDDEIEERIILADGYIYYISDHSIIKLKNDGTERSVVQTWAPPPSEEYLDDVFLVAYADGMLYYHKELQGSGKTCAIPVNMQKLSKTVWPSSEVGVNGDNLYYTFGAQPKKVAVVGDYLYYIDKQFTQAESLDSYSLCRKDMKNGEEECLRADIRCLPWAWKIYRGWLYYTDKGAVKRVRLTGAENAGDEQILADNGVVYENWVENIYMGVRCYSLMLDEDSCYYLGNDEHIYSVSLDGGEPKMLPPSGIYCAFLEGELYTTNSIAASPIMVSDKAGENGRPLFDSAPLLNQKAMEAYAAYLETYNPIAGAESYVQPAFACQDIDGDGIREMFVEYAYYQHYCVDYYRYNGWGVETVWQEVSGDTIGFNLEAGEMAMSIRNSLWDREFVRYRLNGELIQKTDYSFGGADRDAQLAAYEAAYNTYIAPYPTLNFVDNTPENRQKYLFGNMETGWTSQ